MRFTSPAMTSALRAAAQPRMATQKQVFGGLRRQYSSNAEQPKNGGSKILLTTLLGAGVVGGIMYNSSQTKVLPVVGAKGVEEPKKDLPVVFNSDSFVQLKLAEIEPISHNTSIFRFELPKDHIAGLPVASCIFFKHLGENGKNIIRPYTPVSESDAQGHVDFVIKRYETGKMTPIIHNLKVGDTLEMKGPIPKYNWEKDQKANVGMIAGGTGITPMLQIIRRVFDGKSTDKKTKISLIFANVTEGDILLKDELDKIAKEHPDHFKVTYVLDKAPENWKGPTGYVTKDVAKEHLPAADQQDTIIFVCGPPPMVNSLSGPKDKANQGELKGVLKELGYNESNVFKF